MQAEWVPQLPVDLSGVRRTLSLNVARPLILAPRVCLCAGASNFSPCHCGKVLCAGRSDSAMPCRRPAVLTVLTVQAVMTAPRQCRNSADSAGTVLDRADRAERVPTALTVTRQSRDSADSAETVLDRDRAATVLTVPRQSLTELTEPRQCRDSADSAAPVRIQVTAPTVAHVLTDSACRCHRYPRRERATAPAAVSHSFLDSIRPTHDDSPAAVPPVGATSL